MNINATLFVQAAHFFIAYLLFRFLLLKPAYEEIQKDAAEQVYLEDMVAQDKRGVEKERQVQRDAWHQFRGWCRDVMPSIEEVSLFFRGIVPKIKMKKVDDRDKKAAKKRLTHVMVKVAKERYDS